MVIPDETPQKEPGKGKRGRKPERRLRTPTEILRDRRLVARLRLRYHLWTQEDIAEEINRLNYTDRTVDAEGKEPPLISARQVSTEIKKLEARLEAEAVSDTLKLRRIRIAEYRELEAFCYERYAATVGTHTKTTTKAGEESVTEEELAGERGYLELAAKCKDKITELEGITPPRKIAPTNPDGTKPYDAFSESEEIKRLTTIFEQLTKGGGSAPFGGV